MNHADHVALLRGGVEGWPGGRRPPAWADMGAGSGAFTLALAELLGPGALIYAVDRDARALQTLAGEMRRRFPATALRLLPADFTGPLDFGGDDPLAGEGPLDAEGLDGITAANALHFVPAARQAGVAARWKGYLRPGGRLIVVEYEAARGNRWVPHPLPFARWQETARAAGFEHTRLLADRPSSFLNAFYAAASW